MKKTRYIPFERNRYFYGKLLTVRDFASEQTYLNDKRRLVNRLIHGVGIVSGLHVVAVDEKSISVESGVALDYSGREIVVPAPVTLKLSLIDGFSNNQYAKNVYLYLSYDERGKEPVHAVTNTNTNQDEVTEYSRIAEQYRLTIQEEAPAVNSFESVEMRDTSQLLYQDEQVRVYLRTPRYAVAGARMKATLHIEKTKQTPRIQFEAEWSSETYAAVEGNQWQFKENNDSQKTYYEIPVWFEEKSNRMDLSTNSTIQFKSSAKLQIGDRNIVVEMIHPAIIERIKGSILKRIESSYASRSLDHALDDAQDRGICLARLNLIQMGPTYVIESIDQNPFQERVFSNLLLHELSVLNAQRQPNADANKNQTLIVKTSVKEVKAEDKPSFHADYLPEHHELQLKLQLPQVKKTPDLMTSGVVEIPLKRSGIFSKSTKSVFSDEIEHGLGVGSVLLNTALECNDGHMVTDLTKHGDRVYHGDLELFMDSEFEPDVPVAQMGAIVYSNKGTFRIGIRLSGASELPKIRVRWWAQKRGADKISD